MTARRSREWEEYLPASASPFARLLYLRMYGNKRVNIQRRSPPMPTQQALSSRHDVQHGGSIAQKHSHPSSTSSDRLARTSVSTAAMVVAPEAKQPRSQPIAPMLSSLRLPSVPGVAENKGMGPPKGLGTSTRGPGSRREGPCNPISSSARGVGESEFSVKSRAGSVKLRYLDIPVVVL
jgi:hypothetical protein